jgi:iron complex outermembrane receptor protein
MLRAVDRATDIFELPAFWVDALESGEFTGIGSLSYSTSLNSPDMAIRGALERLPGVLVQDSFGGFDSPRLSVRGSGIQSAPVSRGLSITLNGFPLNYADGSFHLPLLESRWIAAAKLTAGPAAGVPSMGGALSLWTSGGLFSEGNQLTTSYGSYDTGYIGGRMRWGEGSFYSAVEGGVAWTDGWRSQSAQRRESMLWSSRWKLGENREVVSQLFVSRPRYDVPGPLSKEDAMTDPRGNIMRVTVDQPRWETDYVQAGSRLQGRDGDGSWAIGVSGAWHDDHFRQLLPNGITQRDGFDAAMFAHWNRDWEGNLQHHSQVDLLMQTGSWSAIRHTNAAGEEGAKIGDNRLRPDSLTLALGHRVAVARGHSFEAGVSFYGMRRKMEERMDYAALGRESTALRLSETALAPRIAWNWQPAETIVLTVAFSRSYEPATFGDLLSTRFQPPPPIPVLQSVSLKNQRADAVDFLVTGVSGAVRWRTGLHLSRWDGEFLRLVDENGSARGTVNADRTLRYIWESSASAMLWEMNDITFSGWLNHQWSEVRFDDDPVYGKNRLGGIPPHAAAMGLNLEFGNGWQVSPGVYGQSGQAYADHANTLSSGGFAVYTLDVQYAHTAGWSVLIRGGNLLDRRYISSTAGIIDVATGPNQFIFLPGSGRRFSLMVDYQW